MGPPGDHLLAADWNHWPDGAGPAEIAATAARLGVRGLELGVYDTSVELSASRVAEWGRLSAQHAVPVRMLLYSMTPERWPDGGLGSRSVHPRLFDQVESLLATAGQLGHDAVGLWPGADPPAADRSVMEAAVAELSSMAARQGVRIALEPKPGTAVAAPADVLRLTSGSAGPDHIGVLLDTGHEFAAGRDPAASVADLRGRLLHVHLGDSDGDPDADLPPGRVHPLDPFLAALDAVGYAGAMSPDAYGAVAAGVVTGVEALEETIRCLATYRGLTGGAATGA